jgi:hypothetical protein
MNKAINQPTKQPSSKQACVPFIIFSEMIHFYFMKMHLWFKELFFSEMRNESQLCIFPFDFPHSFFYLIFYFLLLLNIPSLPISSI